MGLCEEGLVVDVPAGTYTGSRDNKGYALRAVQLLREDATLATGAPTALWDKVVNGQDKAHNSQMDVVLALWQSRLILSA